MPLLSPADIERDAMLQKKQREDLNQSPPAPGAEKDSSPATPRRCGGSCPPGKCTRWSKHCDPDHDPCKTANSCTVS